MLASKSASIHPYFPTKGMLGGVLANRYTSDLAAYLDGLLADGLIPGLPGALHRRLPRHASQ
jgi:hypothetical protein